MGKRKEEEIDYIPNALGLMYFEEKSNSKITIDGESFKKAMFFVSLVLFVIFTFYTAIF